MTVQTPQRQGATGSVALLYPGDRAMRERADPTESRFAALFSALAERGLSVQPAVYHDEFADEVQAQLSTLDAVLVWHNPIEGGRRRERLDTMLRQLALQGVYVSTHPDTITRLGTKDVLFDTRDLPFGSDVHRVDNLAQLDLELPLRLRHGPRVLKQHRGHSGIGVWRVEWAEPQGATPMVLLRHAQRGCEPQCVDWPTLRQTLAPYFESANGGHMIDQAWQPRITDGMVRAYLVGAQVAGFGHQAVNALVPSAPGAPSVVPGQRLYVGPDAADFQPLRQRLESGWIDMLRQRVGLGAGQLPLLWDCDFMWGESQAGEAARFVLCEVNVSSVSPFPPSAITPLIDALCAKLEAGTG